MIRHLENIVQRLSNGTYVVGAVAIGIMMVQVVAHVFSQYVLNYPLPGTILFVSNYYMVVVTFLCLAAVELKGGHIAVDLFYGSFPKSLQTVFTAFSYLITVVMFSLLTWQSFGVAESRRVAGTFEVEYGIKILIWPSYYLVPIGAGLFAFAALVKLAALMSGAPATARGAPSEPL